MLISWGIVFLIIAGMYTDVITGVVKDLGLGLGKVSRDTLAAYRVQGRHRADPRAGGADVEWSQFLSGLNSESVGSRGLSSL